MPLTDLQIQTFFRLLFKGSSHAVELFRVLCNSLERRITNL